MPPPSPMVERCTAKMCALLGLTDRSATSVEVRPVLASVQLSPLSVERYIPSPQPAVPAKIVPFSLIASDQMFPQSKPLFTGVQLSPLSVDLKTPPPKYAPAKI